MSRASKGEVHVGGRVNEETKQPVSRSADGAGIGCTTGHDDLAGAFPVPALNSRNVAEVRVKEVANRGLAVLQVTRQGHAAASYCPESRTIVGPVPHAVLAQVLTHLRSHIQLLVATQDGGFAQLLCDSWGDLC